MYTTIPHINRIDGHHELLAVKAIGQMSKHHLGLLALNPLRRQLRNATLHDVSDHVQKNLRELCLGKPVRLQHPEPTIFALFVVPEVWRASGGPKGVDPVVLEHIGLATNIVVGQDACQQQVDSLVVLMSV